MAKRTKPAKTTRTSSPVEPLVDEFLVEAGKAISALDACRQAAFKLMEENNWPALSPEEHLAVSRAASLLSKARDRTYEIPESRKRTHVKGRKTS